MSFIFVVSCHQLPPLGANDGTSHLLNETRSHLSLTSLKLTILSKSQTGSTSQWSRSKSMINTSISWPSRRDQLLFTLWETNSTQFQLSYDLTQSQLKSVSIQIIVTSWCARYHVMTESIQINQEKTQLSCCDNKGVTSWNWFSQLIGFNSQSIKPLIQSF